MRWWAAAAAAGLVLTSRSPVLADGLSTAPYRYVNPPPFLRNSNLPPGFASQTIGLHQSNWFVFTSDAQAALSSSQVAFAHPPAQSGVHITITALHSFPRLPATPIRIPGTNTQSPLTLDGNVYGFKATYVPSKQPASPTKPVLITLEYPHTPYEMVALHGSKWQVICSQTTLTLTPSTAACNEKTVAPAAALLYVPVGGQGLRVTTKPRSGSSFPWLVVIPLAVAAVLAVILASWLVFARKKPSG